MRKSVSAGPCAFVWMVLLPAGGFSASAGVQDPSHPCAAIAVPEERLACFDKAFPNARSAVDDFGLSARERLDKKAGGIQEPERIMANILDVSLRRSSRAVLTLDNGQSWEIGPDEGVTRVRAGERVTVRKASLGSYLLSMQGGLSFRAKRVK